MFTDPLRCIRKELALDTMMRSGEAGMAGWSRFTTPRLRGFAGRKRLAGDPAETNLGALATEAARPGGLDPGAEQLIGVPAVRPRTVSLAGVAALADL
jgi:hypothetical protein